MACRIVRAHALVLATLLAPTVARGQGSPPEITELRRRVAVLRTEMPAITAAADYIADLFTRDTTARFLISNSRNPATWTEFHWHTGAGPDMNNADDPSQRGVLLIPVRSWDAGVFTVAATVEQAYGAGRGAIVIGPAADKPQLNLGHWFLDNAAPTGANSNSAINGIANLIVAWSLYVEFAGAATRHGWRPGLYASHMVPGADGINSTIRFHAPALAGAPSIAPIPAGRLGDAYLARVDSLLALAAAPQHRALVQRAADSLRAVRAAGHRLYVGACAHYLQAELTSDTMASPFTPVDAQWEVGPPLVKRGAHRDDGVLWFGYGGYNCPHVEAEQELLAGGFRVVAVADNLPAHFANNVIAAVPLVWQLPERIGNIPWNAEGIGSASSVDAAVHYLWLKRLVGQP